MDSKEIAEGRNTHVEDALASLTGFINEDDLLELASRFSETYRDLAKSSTEHFLVTPVTALPTGKEKGRFLSIDVGGTNLRVGFIELLGELLGTGTQNGEAPASKIRKSHDKSWPIEEHMKMDQAEDLFAWIGDCIAEVITDALNASPASESPFGDELLLGITFSFPMAQTRLSEATLLPMGKGFAITSNLNLGKMLLAGYSRHLSNPTITNGHSPTQLPRLRIAAITNDTVATFASLAYAVKAAPNSRVAMGLIVGTGTNATVPMPLAALHPAKRSSLANPDAVDTVVINTEWTIRGTDKPLNDMALKTKWDLELDGNSEAPGFQPFEYMTAGRYLGEIVRLVFVHLVSSEGQVPASLKTRNAIATRFLSEVVARADDTSLTAELENMYPSPNRTSTFWIPARVQLLRDIAQAVQQRSSALIAAACVGLLACVNDIHIDNNQTQLNGEQTHKRSANSGTTTSDFQTDAPKPDHEDQAAQDESDSDREELVIAYAGGTISHYPDWLSTCQRWIDALVTRASPQNQGKKVVLREALDGGIIGAGVLAGMTDEIA
ncbi:hexokinase-2 [Westerdykella ornata]|uniref:Phosphotransferase n=1 Tax=Westerdykella ornata TaxID=318751 RepID=A0A6A6JQW7_WESOR|nr:hexokinase-2 [Westerdykella ornata]KAF2279021.1 hexokinase-2 [Westerdykella ornata]